MRRGILTSEAPPPVGPYAQAMQAGNLLFVSGQLPIDPRTGELLQGTLRAQTEQALRNIKAIVEAAGATLEQVVKVTVYVRDLDQTMEINETYEKFFAENPPARVMIQAARLPKDAGIEIDAIAMLEA